MHTHGLRSVLGNWSVGVPDLPTWQTYRPLLNEMRPGVDADLVGCHEYWSDYADIGNRWHCGRWTMVPELAGKQIAITECGRDYLSDINRGKPGWQLTCDAPTYMADLRAYSRLLDAYPNVVGATVYQVGAIDPKWKPFDVTSVWGQVVAEYAEEAIIPAPPPPPIIPPVEVPMFPVVGKTFDVPGFRAYLQTVKPFVGAKWVCVHHTASPTAATWLKHTQEYWAKQLQSYYSDQGWTACPHLFISERGILVENPLNLYGRGVIGHNQDSAHVETVGNYTKIPPSGPTLDNLIAACAALLKWAGLGIGGLTNHRSLQAAYTQCPGDGFIAVWGSFQKSVGDILTPPTPTPVVDLPSSETATDAATLATKVRWWLERYTREREAGNIAKADAILYDLIDQSNGILYRLERLLKTKPGEVR